MHHANPTSSVLEVATDTDGLIFQGAELARLAETWDVVMAVPDEALEKDTNGPHGSCKVLNFRNDLPGDVFKDQYDIICVNEAALRVLIDHSGEAFKGMCEAVKHGGTLCLLAADSVLSSVQLMLEAGNIMKPSLHIPAAGKGSGLAIVKKDNFNLSNGALSSLSNGCNGSNESNGVSPEREITILLASDPTALSLTVAVALISRLQEHRYKTRVFRWGSDVSALEGRACISLLEIGKPLLQGMTANDFESLRKLILETKSLFWATALNDPSAALIDGLVRVVRNETPGLDVRLFHADEPSSHVAPASMLAGLMSRAFLWTGSDNEFQVKGDILQICRAMEDTELNEEIDGLLPGAAKTITKVPLGKIEYPVKLCVQSPGMLSSVCLEPDESAEIELEPCFVEIQTKASALK